MTPLLWIVAGLIAAAIAATVIVFVSISPKRIARAVAARERRKIEESARTADQLRDERRRVDADASAARHEDRA